jgi:hypothetical protein
MLYSNSNPNPNDNKDVEAVFKPVEVNKNDNNINKVS